MAKGNKGPRVEKTAAEKAAIAAAKAEKFVKIAKARTSRAIKAINLLQNLSGSGYAYTPEQASQIVAALDKAVAALARRFEGKSKAETFDFQ